MTAGPPDGVVGRGAEIDVLQSFIERAGLGGEALVLVGDAGVGKTALLDVAARRAGSLGVSVVRAAGAEFEADISFSALHQSLLPLLNGIEELRPLYRDALSVALGLGEGRPPDRLVVSGAALELVRRAGQEQPLLIVLDDVFWMDRPSAEVLGFVARRLAGSHVGLLAALRDATGSVFEGSGLPQYQLEPLDWDAADGLVRARFPILGPDMRRRLLAEAAGNPLALLELPAALSGRRPFASPGSPAPLPLSARLSELFASRVEELPPATRRLLLLAALDGTGDLADAAAGNGRRRAAGPGARRAKPAAARRSGDSPAGLSPSPDPLRGCRAVDGAGASRSTSRPGRRAGRRASAAGVASRRGEPSSRMSGLRRCSRPPRGRC